MTMPPARALCAVVVALAVLTVGCQPHQPAAAPQRPAVGPVQPATTPIPAPPTTPSELTRSVGSLPVSVSIPRIDARSSLLPLGLNSDGSVQVPPLDKPQQAGWYAGGAAPGEAGPAVLLGHVDGDRQAGIFFRLHELGVGDNVLVTREDGTVLDFTVTRIDKVAKNAFPTAAVYGATTDPELRLLTCGGDFDRAAHSYVDNVIVYAKLIT